MDATHLHLVLNHIPVLGTPFALGLLIYGLCRRSEELKKTALGVLCIVTLLAVPVYLTGESAAEVGGASPEVSKPFIERHDQAAAIAFTVILIVGITAFIGLLRFRRGKKVPNWFAGSILGGLLLIAGLMAWTANLGGQIRHTEIRPIGRVP